MTYFLSLENEADLCLSLQNLQTFTVSGYTNFKIVSQYITPIICKIWFILQKGTIVWFNGRHIEITAICSPETILRKMFQDYFLFLEKLNDR